MKKLSRVQIIAVILVAICLMVLVTPVPAAGPNGWSKRIAYAAAIGTNSLTNAYTAANASDLYLAWKPVSFAIHFAVAPLLDRVVTITRTSGTTTGTVGTLTCASNLYYAVTNFPYNLYWATNEVMTVIVLPTGTASQVELTFE
jgi:hypothetical protein